jgi:2-polyprenyl-3-methyl-5-hydroxy-6-metoxy-1,4-benzoquinol methylase
MKDIFDNYIETSFETSNQDVSKLKQFEFNYRVLFPKNLSSRVLDIGIGKGEMLTCMKHWGFDYLGIDISPSTVNLCKNLNLKCELIIDSSTWLFENSQKYSLISCLDVLEHVPREKTIDFLRGIHHALESNGLAIIQVPNLQSPFGYLHHFNDFTHVSGFVEHSLGQVLLTSGFSEFQFYEFEDLVEFSFRSKVRYFLRYFFRKSVRLMRAINGNPNPYIISPVFFVVAKKK